MVDSTTIGAVDSAVEMISAKAKSLPFFLGGDSFWMFRVLNKVGQLNTF